MYVTVPYQLFHSYGIVTYTPFSIYIQPEDGFLKPKHVTDNCLN